jgi:hypothetical protein
MEDIIDLCSNSSDDEQDKLKKNEQQNDNSNNKRPITSTSNNNKRFQPSTTSNDNITTLTTTQSLPTEETSVGEILHLRLNLLPHGWSLARIVDDPTKPYIWAYAAGPRHRTDHEYSGKWLVTPSIANGNDVFMRLYEIMRVENGLGSTAKISRMSNNGRTVVICVYTNDWRDTDDVRRVLCRLREAGIQQTLLYKTDRATRDRIYEMNSCKYSSRQKAPYDLKDLAPGLPYPGYIIENNSN